MFFNFKNTGLAKSFQARFLIAVVPTVVIINIVFAIIAGLLGIYSDKKEIIKYYHEAISARAAVLVEPLWNLEQERVHELLTEFVLDINIIEAKIYEFNKLTYQTKNKGKRYKDVNSYKVPILYTPPKGNKTHNLGTLQVTFSSERASDAFVSKIIESIVISFFLSIILSYCIFRVARKKIILPLNILTNTIEKSSRDNKRYHVEWSSSCEFGVVTKTFNKMQTHLDHEEAKLIEVNKKLDYVAYHDELTGLKNRACCNLDMAKHFSNISLDEKFSIIHLDLDDFKRVNDTLGHKAGDRLLQEVGFRLELALQNSKNSQAYRWGGDEFVILFDESDGNLEELCAELTDLLSVKIPYYSSLISPSASIGAATYPDDGKDFDTLMVHADLALYKSKDAGRDNYTLFTKHMRKQLDQETEIEQEFREALLKHELFLAYQPQIDINSKKVTGLEALIRWDHPQKGVLTPFHFLNTIENSSLAGKLGKYVFNDCFKAARYWLDHDVDFGKVSVNLSPTHIKLNTAIYDCKESLRKYKLDSKYVCAEVLESVFLDGKEDSRQVFIDELNQMGITIELDDFGTGFASLSHLADLSIHGLKIDKSFTQKMLSDNRKAIVIQSIFNLSKLLNLRLVCEGVETVEQLSYLKSIGNCDIQGYYIAKPMPFIEITEWLKEGRNFDIQTEGYSKTQHIAS